MFVTDPAKKAAITDIYRSSSMDCLALRERGLGSCWTTLHLLEDGERQVAEVLGIPYEKFSQGALLPIAYTKGTDFKPARRLPAEQLTHWNTW